MTRAACQSTVLLALADWSDADLDLLRRLVALGAPSALCQSLCDDVDATVGKGHRSPTTDEQWRRGEVGAVWRALSRQRGDRR